MSTPAIPLNDGTEIPWLAFGTGTALYGSEAAKEVEAAIRAGFRHIDAAQMYKNEESVGAGVAAAGVPRSELYIVTKLHELPPGQSVVDSLKDSLKKLRTEYVDLFLIHMPNAHSDLKAVWKGMEETKAQGLAKSIGVSNFTPKYLRTVLEGATVVPSVNQIEYHPYVLTATVPTLDLQAKHNIVTTSFGGLSPIVRGKGGPLDSVLEKVAKRASEVAGKDVTQGQVLQLWLRKKGIPAITTTRTPARLQEYLAVLKLPDLSDADVEEIDQVGGKEHRRYFAKWIDSESKL